MDNSENKQKELFNKISDDYTKHYSDPLSISYRNEFFFEKMFSNIDFKNKKILDAMCGGGQVTKFLMKNECYVYALDISENQISEYKKKYPQNESQASSILKTNYEDNFFDYVVINGGLHHVHPYLNDAMKEIIRITKQNGQIILCEPSANTFFDFFRKIWYKFDSYFEENEASVDYNRIDKKYQGIITKNYISHGGFFAYYLIYNSMIFRIPYRTKKYISKPLFAIDRAIDKFPNKFFSAYSIARYTKL
jgi:ubiquinone/menaquinone biosynthesis C-methylase UbiE